MYEEKKKKIISDEEKKPKSEKTDGNSSVGGASHPGIELPAFNPPVPNRAWTAMRKGLDIEQLSESEKADLYIGKDNIF